MMRDTEASAWIVQNPSRTPWRGLKLAVAMLGIGLVMITAAARAADDDDDDDKTFEEKIIQGIMAGIGGTNMENRGIQYRERSPLVVPPKLDLPPPASSAEVTAPNWPKDPDAQQRKAAAAARKKENKDPALSSRLLTPAELNAAKTANAGRAGKDPVQPGNSSNSPILSPSQLGYNGGLTGMFKGNQSETAPFTGEPTRDSLVQPPSGYQTPSPNFAYGTGPKESLNKRFDVLKGKEVDF
jgi:hypothetical protein